MNRGLTLLEIKNIFGDQAFPIFDSYGKIAGMSDFAIATGGGFNRDYLSPNSLPGGWWWTQTPDGDNDVQAVS